MDFNIVRGEPFTETFNFKDTTGQAVHLHGMTFEVVLEHGQFVVCLDANSGLAISPLEGSIGVNLDGEFTKRLPYSLLKYTLYYTFEGERTTVTNGMVIVN